MDLSVLPEEIESIIVGYVNQLCYTEKYDKVIKEMRRHLLYTSINKVSYLLIRQPKYEYIQMEDFTYKKLMTRGDMNWLVVSYNQRLRELDRKVRVKNNIVPFIKERNIRFWSMPNPQQFLPNI